MYFAQTQSTLEEYSPERQNWGAFVSLKHVNGSGERPFEKLEALQLEGMVMKRKDSVYVFMRCRDWLKVRTSAGRVTMQKRIQIGAKRAMALRTTKLIRSR